MTIEELKAEAKAQGYKLIKNTPMPRPLPCTCGRRPGEWYSSDPKGVLYRCVYCYIDADVEPTRRKAIEAWNRRMQDEAIKVPST